MAEEINGLKDDPNTKLRIVQAQMSRKTIVQIHDKINQYRVF